MGNVAAALACDDSKMLLLCKYYRVQFIAVIPSQSQDIEAVSQFVTMNPEADMQLEDRQESKLRQKREEKEEGQNRLHNLRRLRTR